MVDLCSRKTRVQREETLGLESNDYGLKFDSLLISSVIDGHYYVL